MCTTYATELNAVFSGLQSGAWTTFDPTTNSRSGNSPRTLQVYQIRMASNYQTAKALTG